MCELSEKLDSLPIVGPRGFFSRSINSDMSIFVVESDTGSPRFRTSSWNWMDALESTRVPHKGFVGRVVLPIALAKIFLSAIETSMVFVVNQYQGIGHTKNYSVHQFCVFVSMFFRGSNCRSSSVVCAGSFAPARKPFALGKAKKILGIDDGILPFVERDVPDGGIVGDGDGDLVDGNGLVAATTVSVRDRIFGRGHARSNQRVGFIRRFQRLTPQVYQDCLA